MQLDGPDMSCIHLKLEIQTCECRDLKSKVPVKSVTDKTVPGPDGNLIPIRIYQPNNAKPRRQGLPILVYFHGGGFFTGSIATYDDMCRNIGHLSAYIVISVKYRYLLSDVLFVAQRATSIRLHATFAYMPVQPVAAHR